MIDVSVYRYYVNKGTTIGSNFISGSSVTSGGGSGGGSDGTKVNKSGDIMTGDLTVNTSVSVLGKIITPILEIEEIIFGGGSGGGSSYDPTPLYEYVDGEFVLINTAITDLYAIKLEAPALYPYTTNASVNTAFGLRDTSIAWLNTYRRVQDSSISTLKIRVDNNDTSIAWLNTNKVNKAGDTMTGDLIVNTNVIVKGKVNSDIFDSSLAYVSGFAGAGFKLMTVAGKTSLEVDNLSIREKFSASVLEIKEITSVGGSLAISRANGIPYSVVGTRFYFDTNNNANPIQFVVNDYIKAQIWTGTEIGIYEGQVTSVAQSTVLGSAYLDATTITGTPWSNMKLFQKGNSTDSARQSLIYITAADVGNPYIDILSGVNTNSFINKQIFRAGKLDGITDTNFGGALSGDGVYLKNIYATGQIIIGNPEDIDQTALSNSAEAGAQVNTINSGDGLAALDSGANTKLGTIAAGAQVNTINSGDGLAALDSGANTKLGTIAAGATVGATWGTNLNSIPDVFASVADNKLAISDDFIGFHATGTNWPVKISNDAGTGKFFVGNANNYLDWSGSALTVVGNITATSGKIGGWDITSNSIQNWVIDSSGEQFGMLISSYINGYSRLLVQGYMPAYGGVGAGVREIVNINTTDGIFAVKGQIGGWEIGSDYIKSGTTGNTGISSAATAGDDVRFWAGSTTPTNAPFRVTKSGSLTATGIGELGTAVFNAGGYNGNVSIKGSQIWENSQTTDDGTIYINWNGYHGGTSKYRDFAVFNGKNQEIMWCNGDMRSTEFAGPVYCGTNLSISNGNLSISNGYLSINGSITGIYLRTSNGINTDTDIFAGGTLWSVGAFGCNGKTPQTAFYTGTIGTYTFGTHGFSTDNQLQTKMDLLDRVVTALKNNGIMY